MNSPAMLSQTLSMDRSPTSAGFAIPASHGDSMEQHERVNPTHNLHSGLSKKSRATSCTSCRQVKLKCNVKEVYPQPCSRCASNKLDCRMDASFKRVPARHRIKELTNQLDQLKRAKTLEHAVEPPEITLRPHPQTAGGHQLSSSTDAHFSPENGMANTSPATSSSTSLPKLLVLNGHSTLQQWCLGELTVSHDIVLDLFRHFEEFYYPHFRVLEPINSLTELSKASQLLFWTILAVTASNHPRHANLVIQLRDTQAKLLDQTCREAIQSLLDLQALLIMCQWPNPTREQLRDPSWMQLGMAINAARQMGLDKAQDEVLFGSRHARFAIKKHPPEVLKMTWMKCFELDLLMSVWLGHLPTLSSAPYLRTVSAFCEDGLVPREYAAMVKIQHQVARFNVTLGDGFAGGARSSLVRMFDQGLGTVKTNYIQHWSVNTEIMLLSAKLHLYALCLVHADQQDDISSGPGLSDETVFISEILQASHTSAVRLITLMTELCASTTDDPYCDTYEHGGTPGLAYPKAYFRNAFFAAVVLLKYLDFNRYASPQDVQEARNAVSQNYQMFTNFRSSSQHMDSSRSLEILGRSVGPDWGKLKSHVTTRLSASLMYNAIWLAATLRSREKDPEYAMELHIQSEKIETPYHDVFQPTPQQTQETAWLDPTEGLQMPFVSMPTAGSDSFALPFGVWDNAVYDSWAAGGADDIDVNWDLNMDLGQAALW